MSLLLPILLIVIRMLVLLCVCVNDSELFGFLDCFDWYIFFFVVCLDAGLIR